jgi:hypothetical protein
VIRPLNDGDLEACAEPRVHIVEVDEEDGSLISLSVPLSSAKRHFEKRSLRLVEVCLACGLVIRDDRRNVRQHVLHFHCGCELDYYFDDTNDIWHPALCACHLSLHPLQDWLGMRAMSDPKFKAGDCAYNAGCDARGALNLGALAGEFTFQAVHHFLEQTARV